MMLLVSLMGSSGPAGEGAAFWDAFWQSVPNMVATIVFGLIGTALQILALWFIFRKAGQHGWAAIIPFYNTYVLFKITWGSGWYFFLLLIPIANIVFIFITDYKLSRSFGHGVGYFFGLAFLPHIFELILAFDKSKYRGPWRKKAA